jgi:hypothetical protein
MSQPNKCNHCHEPAFHRCGRCHNIYYCSQHCQRLDYSVHKQVCPPVLKSSPSKDTQPLPVQEKESSTDKTKNSSSQKYSTENKESSQSSTSSMEYSTETKESSKNSSSSQTRTNTSKQGHSAETTQTKNSNLNNEATGQSWNFVSDSPFGDMMASFYANLSPTEIAKGLLENPNYKHRKDCLDLRLAGGGPVKGLFLRAIKNRFISKSDRAFVLIYGSIQAIDRDLDNKMQEGDFLGLQAIPVDDLLSSWQSKQNLEQFRDDLSMIYVSVCTYLPLSTMQKDLKDMTICHCITVFSRKECMIDY